MSMIFENIIKRFAVDMLVKVLPQILRAIADQIEQGGTIQITEATLTAAIEQHQDLIKAAGAEVST